VAGGRRFLPRDWFGGSLPVLVQLVRHIKLSNDMAGDVARARAAIDEIQKMPEPPLKLLLAAMKEYRVLARCHAQQLDAAEIDAPKPLPALYSENPDALPIVPAHLGSCPDHG
jgi:hypothetical protein